MDDDIICLSSDNDDSSQSSQKNSFMNGNRTPAILHIGGFNHNSQSQGITNGHTSTGSTVVNVKPKKETEEQDIVTLNSDDDSEFEIEYSSQGRGHSSNGGTQTIDSDDDDIQVLEENIKVNHQQTPEKRMIESMSDRRKSYLENQQNQKKEVKLTVPVVKGLTPGVHREPKDKTVDAMVTERKEASGNGDSTSQDAVVIDDEDVVMDEAEEGEGEDKEEVDEVDGGDENLNSDSGDSGVKSNDDDVDYRARSRKTLIRFLNEFCARRKEKKGALKKARQRLMEAYEKTVNLSMAVHRRLHERIEHDLEIIRSSAEEHWRTMAGLLVYIEPANLTRDQIKTEDEIYQEREEQKMELRRKYEKELARIQRKIKKLETTDVDWDAEDDYNSAYMLQEKYKAKLVNAYYTLCTLSKCSHFTGRPTQAKIKLKTKNYNYGSDIPEVDAEVERFVNKMGFLHAPDYTDILETIQKVNKSEALGLSEETILRTAQKLFENIFKIIKKRRAKDFKFSMLATVLPKQKRSDSGSGSTPSTSRSNPPANDDEDDTEELEKLLEEDPADSDPVLLAKLEENVKLRKSESEVIDRFARINPTEVIGCNGNDLVAGESENEDDDEDEEDYQDEERKLSRNHQVAELTEDEDEVPETVGFDGSTLTGARRISCDSADGTKANEKTEDEDDVSSNDGKNTGESEMDTDADSTISSAPPPPTVTPEADALIVSKPEVEERNQAKRANDTIELTDTADDDDDDSQPPAKRMRSDENCNEESEVVAKPVTESEELSTLTVPTPTPITLVVENQGDAIV